MLVNMTAYWAGSGGFMGIIKDNRNPFPKCPVLGKCPKLVKADEEKKARTWALAL